MGRIYSVSFDNIAVTAAQDFFELTAASNKPFVIHQILITNRDDETNQQLCVSLARAAGSFTAGTGGAAVTPAPFDSFLSAASTSAARNNTSRAAAGSGSLTRLWVEGWPSQGGFAYLPTPEMRPKFNGSEACVIGLETAPSASLNMSGVVVIEEL